MPVRQAIIKLHVYAGLLTFAQLLIYGAAGPGRHRPARTTTETGFRDPRDPFTPPRSATDKQVADEVYRTLALPLTRPMPAWAIKRTDANDLLLDFYNINGIWRVVVLEREHRLRVEAIRTSGWLFLADVHAATPGDNEAPTRGALSSPSCRSRWCGSARPASGCGSCGGRSACRAPSCSSSTSSSR